MTEEKKTEDVIKDVMPSIVYRDIYLPLVRKRLEDNVQYMDLVCRYRIAARGLKVVLSAIDQKPETADAFKNKKDIFTEIMNLMRMLANIEAAELIRIIRWEYRNGVFVTELLKNGESFESIAEKMEGCTNNE